MDCDGLQLAYQVVGDGPVDVLYVPGTANHIEAMWDIPEMARFTERLAAFSRLVLMDKRGAGLSDSMPNDQRATIEERVRDVWAVLDEVGSESTVLFATADGTPVAMMAAAARPDRVAALVLYAPSARLMGDEGYDGFDEATAEIVLAGLRQAWGSVEDQLIINFLLPSVADDPRWRESFARVQRRSATPRAAAEYWKVNLEVDVREVLPLISAPSLILHCTGDALYPVAHGRAVADLIPDARFVELAGTDHLFFAENGERVADEVEEFVTGRRSGTATHRRLAAVLFTDLVGSTSRDQELGDRRWRALLEAHDAMVAALVDRHRGTLIKSTGDGCLAVFDGPQAAIASAEAIRSATTSLGLQVRAGIHTGEIEHRGDDIAGLAVHIAARVMSQAPASTIFVTRTVKDLVAGSQIHFADRGAHDLKGINEAWHLYEVSSYEHSPTADLGDG
ncbi:MAG: adenylate/guanylate cyclase domain-containing protein [Acidimicrobiales bacterium]